MAETVSANIDFGKAFDHLKNPGVHGFSMNFLSDYVLLSLPSSSRKL